MTFNDSSTLDYNYKFGDNSTLIQLSNSDTDGEVSSFISLNYEDGYKLIVEQSVNKVPVHKISKGSIVEEGFLESMHFKNFTNDNLYKRIFSYIKRFDEGNVNMPL
jgi:hypothetical protein